MSSVKPNISFEFFPPQSLEASFRLWESVQMLAPLAPSFASVTYGAGGSTRKLTHEALGTLVKHYGLNVAGHLTCINATQSETLAIANSYAKAGVNEIVALRGDPPKGQSSFQPHPDGFSGSVDLVRALAETGRFHIRVGAYPDRHPEASDDDADIVHLKRKFDAGADSAITQYFYDIESFLRFRDRCVAAGITGKIIPGILPIEDWGKVKKFSKRCNATLPRWMDDAFAKAKRDKVEDLLSISIATELCSDLMEEGVEDLHFYTLNRPYLTRQICKALGIEPSQALKKVA
ncbi:MAG: methylenetetrahydrofolate reductase [NAD(P)H] [Alphaproteobacteria bacterium]|nr:methylenetetrahydrofolate reductase [NAD(P)H] [Alphaproteobacteria bacterium]